MDPVRYFDNAATTPAHPKVVEAVTEALRHDYGNAHSIHEAGRSARIAVDRAREQVAALLGADDPQEIVFTSGATEANNWILRVFDRLAVSPFEHSSVREPAGLAGAEVLENDGYDLAPPTSAPRLVSVMGVNNETGAILKPPQTGDAKLHRDLTQSVGKVPFGLEGLDFASFSAHKFGGPKGIGGLYIRGGEAIEPLLLGGGQEHGLRAGTLNVPGIVGFGVAAAIALDEREANTEHVRALRQAFLYELGREEEHGEFSPWILSVAFPGLQGETLVVEADLRGFAISSGAACSSESTEPSHVLTALGLPEEEIRGAVRISFGVQNTLDAAIELARTLRAIAESLSGLRKA